MLTEVEQQKRGRFTNDEYLQYRQHVTEGVKLMQSTWKLPAPATLAVAQHHEMLCGGGYPLGLKGDQVGLHGRILGRLIASII